MHILKFKVNVLIGVYLQEMWQIKDGHKLFDPVLMEK